MRIKIKRSLAKLMNRALSGAFDRWYEMVEESKEMKFKLRKYFHRMMNKQLSDGFTLWYQYWQDAVRAREEAAILGELNAVKEARLKQFMMKLMNSQLLGAWEKWMELHEMVRKIKIAVGRMRNKAMSAAFVR